ncbi:MAG: hypothetical protein HYS19_03495 [Nitrosomonadales bacterium]|nr:hypothetical protein [Nitrosomonadales bacterium]
MGIRWQFLFAKFKNRLSLSDLHEATEFAFESCAKALPDIFQALRQSNPEIDHGRLWRNNFAKKLEIIAAEQTRQSQAAECRRMLLKAWEEQALANELLDGEAVVCRMFFKEEVTAEMSDEMVKALVAKRIFLGCADVVALEVLYRQQFNSTLNFGGFSDTYHAMCKLDADYAWREAAHLLLSSDDIKREDGWDKFFVEVIRPADAELAKIKYLFKENLCLLSPERPDPTAFNEFKDRARKAVEPYL